MGLFNLNLGKLKIPLYDIGSFTAGFYIGYKEGKGIYVKDSVEYLCKYGPTAFAVVNTPLMTKTANSLVNFMVKGTRKSLKAEDAELKKKQKALDNLEAKLKNPKYFKPTIKAGAITAIKTLAGYAAGRLWGQLN